MCAVFLSAKNCVCVFFFGLLRIETENRPTRAEFVMGLHNLLQKLVKNSVAQNAVLRVIESGNNLCGILFYFSVERSYNLCRNNVCTGAIDGPDYKAWVERKRLK